MTAIAVCEFGVLKVFCMCCSVWWWRWEYFAKKQVVSERKQTLYEERGNGIVFMLVVYISLCRWCT